MPNPEQLEKIQARIREGEDSLKALDEEITLAERAGVDVVDRRKNYKKLAEGIRRMKAVYGG